MSSSLAFRSSLTVLGIGGAVGGGWFLGKNTLFSNKENTKELISKALEKSLMSFEDSGLSSNWEARKTKLEKAKDPDLVPSLRELKGKSGYTADDVRQWCKENVGGFVDDEDGKKFKNVSDYCTFNIKDKLTKAISNGDWNAAKEKLKQTGGPLSSDMLAIKTELNKTQGGNSDALKQWCEQSYDKMFSGEQDQFFKDASSYCVSS
ncbi:hypothetical protein MHC_02265 [Mycoplasma haemocanis str. Illinois]|uniref:Uncharacterized protein n=1 Tax=Mycoplasma haemocanis (strain Illinois) TaxID=1111676 RepID=H6N6P7_MYCHN|nr:hypothetical protein [Mycoplasma haemocanis]AEW45319.1 hypothetical protein MHC_02265 [Mycoplasma haemocanis str. Illinois]